MTRRWAALLAIFAALAPLRTVSADEGDAKAQAPSERKPSFALVPGPFYNPNQGVGVLVLAMSMFHPDQDDAASPPSIVGLAGMYGVLPPLDDSGTRYSWALGLFSRLFVDQDRWRILVPAVYFDIFRQFRGIGGNTSSTPEFDYRQMGAITIAQVMREVLWKKFYAGLLFGYTTFRTKTDDPANQRILESLGTGSDWRGQFNVGIVAQYDTKDDQYYPTTGVDLNVRLNGSTKASQEYLVVTPGLNQYFPLVGRGRVVLAYRIFGQFGFGDLPLASYAYYGSRGTALGYPTGDFVDKMMAGAEVEVRWLFWRRLGLEGGVAEGKVFPAFDGFGPQPWLPSAWSSITYQVMEERTIRARLTAAVSKSGGALYFAIGQNF